MKLRLNGERIEIETSSLLALLERQGIDHRQNGIAIACNGDVLPRSQWENRTLSEDDELEIITAMQGG